MPQKVEYQVEIKNVGDGAVKAAQQLQEVQKQADVARVRLKQMSTEGLAVWQKEAERAQTSTMLASKSLVGMGVEGAVAATNLKLAARAIRADLNILASYAFPQATLAGNTFMSLFKGIYNSSKALGVGLGTVATGIGSITTVVAAGVQFFKAYRAEMEAIISEGEAGFTAASTRLRALEQLKGLKDFITPNLQARLQGQLGPRQEGTALTDSQQSVNSEFEKMGLAKPFAEGIKGESDADFQRRVYAAAIEIANANRLRAEMQRGVGLRQQAGSVVAGFERGGLTGHEAEVNQLVTQFEQAKARLQELGKTGIDITREMGQVEAAFEDQIFTLHDKKMSAKLFEEIQTRKQAAAEEEVLKKLEDQLPVLVELANKQEELNSLTGDLKHIAAQAQEAFASGLSTAIVDAFSSGEQSFQKFFATFMKGIAQMILQALILRAIQGVFGTPAKAGDGGSFYDAQGGVHFAANGIMTVAQPTFFPRFNVVAGEVPGSPEMLTVLSRPRMMEIGGIQAAVGNAAGNRLAITSAEDLAARAGAGGAEIVIRLSQGLEASIVQNSIAGARIRVVRDLSEDSDASKAVKRLVS